VARGDHDATSGTCLQHRKREQRRRHRLLERVHDEAGAACDLLDLICERTTFVPTIESHTQPTLRCIRHLHRELRAQRCGGLRHHALVHAVVPGTKQTAQARGAEAQAHAEAIAQLGQCLCVLLCPGEQGFELGLRFRIEIVLSKPLRSLQQLVHGHDHGRAPSGSLVLLA
jgi:hypothetical protein